MEVVLFVGLQGAGKSTFYRATFASTHVLVSKDRFRHNRRPQRRQMSLIEAALEEGRSVVVDNTNPTVEDRAAIIGLARAYGATVNGYYFDAPLADCLRRNALRSGKARVPDAALRITLERMCPPTAAEGFDRLFRVSLPPGGEFLVSENPEDPER
jgi:predicted kinase